MYPDEKSKASLFIYRLDKFVNYITYMQLWKYVIEHNSLELDYAFKYSSILW